MNRVVVYVLGVLTGAILILIILFSCGLFSSRGSGATDSKHGEFDLPGLDIFEEPGEFMACSLIEIRSVHESGCALAIACGVDYPSITQCLLIPNEDQHFYDNQSISLKEDQGLQRIGTYRYTDDMDMERTIPAVKIVDGVTHEVSEERLAKEDKSKTLFEKPGECVSRKHFEVQQVLESGDAIAYEIRDITYGYVSTSELKVLFLAGEGSNFYEKQILRCPKGKCARQIGNYSLYNGRTVIPIVAFR